MEEDVAGPREDVVGERYTLCSRCQRPVLRRAASLTEQGMDEETISEQEELCDRCRAELQRDAKGDA